ncbi:MAG: hypothetical protein K0R25_1075 [Rickettsiaceae bacterium]|jgi:hypothetical protein|nr:hypothetical protein [Rickettsiaceae bacterium]
MRPSLVLNPGIKVQEGYKLSNEDIARANQLQNLFMGLEGKTISVIVGSKDIKISLPAGQSFEASTIGTIKDFEEKVQRDELLDAIKSDNNSVTISHKAVPSVINFLGQVGVRQNRGNEARELALKVHAAPQQKAMDAVRKKLNEVNIGIAEGQKRGGTPKAVSTPKVAEGKGEEEPTEFIVQKFGMEIERILGVQVYSKADRNNDNHIYFQLPRNSKLELSSAIEDMISFFDDNNIISQLPNGGFSVSRDASDLFLEVLKEKIKEIKPEQNSPKEVASPNSPVAAEKPSQSISQEQSLVVEKQIVPQLSENSAAAVDMSQPVNSGESPEFEAQRFGIKMAHILGIKLFGINSTPDNKDLFGSTFIKPAKGELSFSSDASEVIKLAAKELFDECDITITLGNNGLVASISMPNEDKDLFLKTLSEEKIKLDQASKGQAGNQVEQSVSGEREEKEGESAVSLPASQKGKLSNEAIVQNILGIEISYVNIDTSFLLVLESASGFSKHESEIIGRAMKMDQFEGDVSELSRSDRKIIGVGSYYGVQEFLGNLYKAVTERYGHEYIEQRAANMALQQNIEYTDEVQNKLRKIFAEDRMGEYPILCTKNKGSDNFFVSIEGDKPFPEIASKAMKLLSEAFGYIKVVRDDQKRINGFVADKDELDCIIFGFKAAVNKVLLDMSKQEGQEPSASPQNASAIAQKGLSASNQK